MKKVHKVSKAQLQRIIQEHAIKEKRILDLKSKRAEIVKQLDEMYEMEDEMEEGKFMDFFKGSHDEWKQKYLDWMMKMKSIHGDNIEIPQGQDLEDAVAAARNAGDVKVVKRNGKWVPTHFVAGDASGAFGAGKS